MGLLSDQNPWVISFVFSRIKLFHNFHDVNFHHLQFCLFPITCPPGCRCSVLDSCLGHDTGVCAVCKKFLFFWTLFFCSTMDLSFADACLAGLGCLPIFRRGDTWQVLWMSSELPDGQLLLCYLRQNLARSPTCDLQ